MQQEDKNIKEIHLMDYVYTIVSRRWMIVRNVVVTVVLALLISFILAQKWTAETTLMPQQEQDKMSMRSVFSDVSMPGLSLDGPTSSSDVLLEILKSRTVAEQVLNRSFASRNDTLPLYKILDYPSVDVGTIKIKKRCTFMVSKQGIISISVELGDPQLAADVANAFVEELDYVNQQKSVSQAKSSRLYIEQQLEKTRKNLIIATKKLAEFQQKNKAVSLENQMASSIKQAGELKGQIIAKEVEIGVMQESMKPENPLLVRSQKQLQEIKRRYQELQYGDSDVKTDSSEFYVPFQDVPEVSLKLAELTRDVRVQETVWELLNRQYYQAKIEEARNTPTVQVLDPALPPVYRSAPNRKMIVIVLGLLSLVFSITLVFLESYWSNLDENSQEKKRVEKIKQEFVHDKQRIRNKWNRKKGH